MEVRNCKKCGRMFNFVSGAPICPACKETMETKFQEVKEYVSEHKTASIVQISEDCEVEVNQIKRWVREERLEFAQDSPIGIPCENCGTTIRCGRFCEKCKNEMVNRLGEAIPKPKQVELPKKKERENPKMRFLDK